LTDGSFSIAELKLQVEKSKVALSSQKVTAVGLEPIKHMLGSERIHESLSRAKFEDLNSDLFEAAMEVVSQILAGLF
jgi:molecular chaperone DnaK (HSP70)